MPEGPGLRRERARWDGRTYYGRPSSSRLHSIISWSAPMFFSPGLSGGAQLLATVIDLARGRVAEPAIRRGRYLSLLAPVLGSACLIFDLHTPRRFYNMLRIFKPTSPMSIGSWILVAFGSLGTATAGAQFLADRVRSFGWLRTFAKATQLPAAAAGWVCNLHGVAVLRDQHAALGRRTEESRDTLRRHVHRIRGDGHWPWRRAQ